MADPQVENRWAVYRREAARVRVILAEREGWRDIYRTEKGLMYGRSPRAEPGVKSRTGLPRYETIEELQWVLKALNGGEWANLVRRLIIGGGCMKDDGRIIETVLMLSAKELMLAVAAAIEENAGIITNQKEQ